MVSPLLRGAAQGHHVPDRFQAAARGDQGIEPDGQQAQCAAADRRSNQCFLMVLFLVFLRNLDTFQTIEIYFAALTINTKGLNIRCGIVMNYELKLVRVSYHFVLFHGVSTPAWSLFNRRTRCCPRRSQPLSKLEFGIHYLGWFISRHRLAELVAYGPHLGSVAVVRGCHESAPTLQTKPAWLGSGFLVRIGCWP